MTSRASLVFVALVLGCSKERAQQPQQQHASVSSAPATAVSVPRVTSDPPPAPKKIDPMSTWKDGMTVTTRGKVSTIIWQHMMTTVKGKKHAYFDVDGETTQTVVYWRAPPTCSGLVEVTGKVIELRGSPKKQGQKESKVDDTYSELHLDVESARCVDE